LFIGNASGQLPISLQHLVRSIEQECYTRVGTITPAMEMVLWQILQCPYQGLTKRTSLPELAKQVKLNELTLRRGFCQVFRTTVFDYLHDYRLEQARQLLEMGNLKAAEVAETVGFASCSYFASAFKQKFGLNPKAYQQQQNFR
jgi:AraC-like DNA-binding protein